MSTYFLADVHLNQNQEATVDAFLAFLDRGMDDAHGLYILGDLFHLWLGDDDTRFPHLFVLDALRRITARGISIGILHGNHDFLLGIKFEKRTGCRILPDPSIIELYGNKVLISHGDILCTDDRTYQEYRKQVRNPFKQRLFLALPLKYRAKKAASVQDVSKEAAQGKHMHIMDVNQDAVKEMMREHNAPYLIHGHTHRPGIHQIPLEEGDIATRIALGDWYQNSNQRVLAWDKDGFRWAGSDG